MTSPLRRKRPTTARARANGARTAVSRVGQASCLPLLRQPRCLPHLLLLVSCWLCAGVCGAQETVRVPLSGQPQGLQAIDPPSVIPPPPSTGPSPVTLGTAVPVAATQVLAQPPALRPGPRAEEVSPTFRVRLE